MERWDLAEAASGRKRWRRTQPTTWSLLSPDRCLSRPRSRPSPPNRKRPPTSPTRERGFRRRGAPCTDLRLPHPGKSPCHSRSPLLVDPLARRKHPLPTGQARPPPRRHVQRRDHFLPATGSCRPRPSQRDRLPNSDWRRLGPLWRPCKSPPPIGQTGNRPRNPKRPPDSQLRRRKRRPPPAL